MNLDSRQLPPEDLNTPTMLRLDLTTEVLGPIRIADKEIDLTELQLLGAKVDAYRRTLSRTSDRCRTLSLIGEQLQEGNLSVFTRETEPPSGMFYSDPKLVDLAEETFGLGSIHDLQEKLTTIPDYNPRLLLEEPEYLKAVAQELRRLNLEHCREHAPHLVEVGGKHVITALAAKLEALDLKYAIVLRLSEGDKMRGNYPAAKYIQEIFGTGFRLERAYNKLHS